MSARPEVKAVDIWEDSNGTPVATLRVSHPASLSVFTFVIDAHDMMSLYQQMDEAFFAFENRPKGLGDDR